MTWRENNMVVKTREKQLVWFEEVGKDNVAQVGGKNANLGEMIRELKNKGIPVPDGFATTANAYRTFLEANNLTDKIQAQLEDLRRRKKPLQEVGSTIRQMFADAEFPPDLAQSIKASYRELSKRYKTDNVSVAVRSSGTAEDLPEASFAGQQESFLNITGEHALLDACKKCYASLFTDRSINYREDRGFAHMNIALSIGVQKMVRSDEAAAGVIFTLDPDTGFRDVVVVTGSWGLGESVVQGQVTPDEFMVFKPLLGKDKLLPIISRTLGAKERKIIYSSGGTSTTKNVATDKQEQGSFCLDDNEVMELARWAVIIEDHYKCPMDIEWAKDGELNKLFIVQARPETVQSRKKPTALKTYQLQEKGKVLLRGLSIGQAIAAGKAQIIKDAAEIGQFKDGAILVTGMTDPDWEPIMKKAAGIITDHGGRTSHAAIVSRELGIPAIVGTREATKTLKDGQEITLSCAEGDEGHVYQGIIKFKAQDMDLSKIPETRTRILMNIASPAGAFRWWQLPVKGIGLARLEFTIGTVIRIHPMALVHFNELKDKKAQQQIREMTRDYDDKSEYFVDNLSQGIAKIAASRYPHPVIVRTSDFKTNEYASLIGGSEFEPEEANPMLGFRGASRYYSDRYQEGFTLECQALKRVREEMGFTNVVVMIPFCRTPEEAEKVLKVLEKNGLKRGENGLEVYVMAEIPTNIILAEQFAEHFDGFSIGSNDLTQLTLGVDRDSSELAYLFDEQNEAVKESISNLIKAAHKNNRKVGLCGQAPSDHPEFAAFLVKAGIDTISVNPDSVLPVIEKVAETEKKG
jgi:pyruvate,water dikinase